MANTSALISKGRLVITCTQAWGSNNSNKMAQLSKSRTDLVRLTKIVSIHWWPLQPSQAKIELDKWAEPYWARPSREVRNLQQANRERYCQTPRATLMVNYLRTRTIEMSYHLLNHRKTHSTFRYRPQTWFQERRKSLKARSPVSRRIPPVCLIIECPHDLKQSLL